MSPEAAALRARVRARARAAGPRLAELTRRFVRIDSQTPPSATGAMAEEAARVLAETPGLAPRVSPSDPPVVNLVARLSGGAPGPRLVFSGHLDTYPIGDRARWREDPLGGEIREGRLYGRGAADMKGGLAALIVAAEAFAEETAPWPGEIVLAFAGDEESMGTLGSQRLLETMPETRGDAALVGDVGGARIPRVGEKGMIWLELRAEGAAAHGAHTHRGANALDRLIAAVAAVQALAGPVAAAPSEVRETIARARPLSEPLGGDGEAETLESVTVNLGRMEGGSSANLVPDAAAAALDIRLPMGVSVAEIEARIVAALAGRAGVSFEVTRRYEPSWTSPAHPLSRAVLAAAEDVLGGRCALNMRVGASDARLFRAAGVPTVVCGLTPHNLGGPDEHLALDELAPIAEIYAAAAAEFLFA